MTEEPVGRAVEAQILARAVRDPKFAEALRTDPKKVLAKEFNIELPEDLSVEVLQEDPHKVYLVLPDPGWIHTAAGERAALYTLIESGLGMGVLRTGCSCTNTGTFWGAGR